MKPLRIGDAQNVVAELSLDRDALEFLVVELPARDGFTQMLAKALDRVDALALMEAEDAVGRPGIRIVVVEKP